MDHQSVRDVRCLCLCFFPWSHLHKQYGNSTHSHLFSNYRIFTFHYVDFHSEPFLTIANKESKWKSVNTLQAAETECWTGLCWCWFGRLCSKSDKCTSNRNWIAWQRTPHTWTIQNILTQLNHFSFKLTTLFLQTALVNKPAILQIFPYSKHEINLSTGWRVMAKKLTFLP